MSIRSRSSKPLGKSAARRLKKLGYNNVTAKVGDGYQGWEEHAPFDKIIVTCSPEDVPQRLIDQLRDGGKMIIPLGERHQQVFYLFEKQEGKLVKQQLIPTLFVPMTGKAEDRRRVKPDPLHPHLVNGGFELDENDRQPRRRLALSAAKRIGDSPGTLGENVYALPERYAGPRGANPAGLRRRRDRRYAFGRQFVGATRGGPAGNTLQYESPSLQIYFYDRSRQVVGDAVVGPWSGSFAWKEIRETVKVPRHATEAIVRVGLNGGVGTMDVDEVRIAPH